MKAFACAVLTLTSIGCSSDRTADQQHRAVEDQREAEVRSSAQKMREKAVLDLYDAEARASCEAEIRKKLKSSVTIVSENTTVTWDPAYLTGERVRTRRQFPASESLIVSMLADQDAAGKKKRVQFTCQVVCLDKGYCNTVSLKPLVASIKGSKEPALSGTVVALAHRRVQE